MLNNFDAAARLLNLGDQKVASEYRQYRQKLDLFFIDHDFVPMLIQENFLNAMQAGLNTQTGGGKAALGNLNDIERMADAADCISLGDQAAVKIRTD